MATGKLLAGSDTVPADANRTSLSVTFQTDVAPSGAQTLAKVDVLNPDGTVAGNVTVTWNGPGAAETTPVVGLPPVATAGWRLSVSQGVLSPKPSVINEFEWERDALLSGPTTTATATLTDPNNGTADQITVTWEGPVLPSTASPSSGTPSSL